MIPDGYAAEDAEQHALGGVVSTTASDARTAFQHDVDRILYSEEFRALGGKTQVVASDQRGNHHNRLTHSLKVAQIGKRFAVVLGNRARIEHQAHSTPDPDLVEAACLLHDIGHPVFGHIGEQEIAQALDDRTDSRHGDGFQANAQNLRIATYLSIRKDRGPRGLHLTRATLDSTTKYPWHRSSTPDTHSDKHWGCYSTEDAALLWVRQNEPISAPPVTKDACPVRPVEEQIMDWADEVTYACHDLEDFYSAGLIPLDRVLALPADDPRLKSPGVPRYETQQFLAYLSDKAAADGKDFDVDTTRRRLAEIQNIVTSMFPYESTQAGRGRTATATSGLLNYFLSEEVRLVPAGQATTGDALTRYDATLEVPSEMREMCRLLKSLIRCYVIDRPGLATQQQGQRRIVSYLVAWYSDDPERLLPDGRREEWRDHQDALRSAADTVAGLTEAEAVLLHRRMSGIDYGQLSDH